MNALKRLAGHCFLVVLILAPVSALYARAFPPNVIGLWPNNPVAAQVNILKQYLDSHPMVQERLVQSLSTPCSTGAMAASTTIPGLYQALLAMPHNIIKGAEIPFSAIACTHQKIAEVKNGPQEPPVLFPWLMSFFRSFRAFMEQPESLAYVNNWLDLPEVRIQDFIVPVGGFTSFNDFFGRRLKPGVRPIDSPYDDAVITSPNDGTVKVMHTGIAGHTPIRAKGDVLNIGRVFGNHPLANRFIGGTVVNSTLHEYSYHHFHAPVSGTIVQADLYPEVSDVDTGNPSPWSANSYNFHRGAYIIHNPELGYVGVVPVGVMFISNITLLAKAGTYVKKGQELGHFAFGGSTLLLFFEPGAVTTTFLDKERPIQVGQTIGLAKQG